LNPMTEGARRVLFIAPSLFLSNFIDMAENYQYAVGIPTINQWPLLRKHLELYAEDMPNTPFIILDNGRQGIALDGIGKPGQFTLLDSPVNLGVAASWNFLIRMIHIDVEYAFIVNDDVYLGLQEREVDTLIYRELSTKHVILAHGDKGFSSFIINREMFEMVGPFDIDYYPAYYEDNDYVMRMSQLGLEPVNIKALTPRVFYGSQSIQKDPSLNENFAKNRQRFMDKWQSEPSKKLQGENN